MFSLLLCMCVLCMPCDITQGGLILTYFFPRGGENEASGQELSLLYELHTQVKGLKEVRKGHALEELCSVTVRESTLLLGWEARSI